MWSAWRWGAAHEKNPLSYWGNTYEDMNLAAALVLLWKYLYFGQAIRRQCYWWRFRSTSKHTDFWSYDPLLQNHGRLRSGPVRRQFDMPKREYIDVLAGRIPSGLQAGPKAEYYQCYRARPKSEYNLSTRFDPKPHTMCYQARPEPKCSSCNQPDSNPNNIRATRSSG